MKKVILFLTIILGMMSCTKDKTTTLEVILNKADYTVVEHEVLITVKIFDLNDDSKMIEYRHIPNGDKSTIINLDDYFDNLGERGKTRELNVKAFRTMDNGLELGLPNSNYDVEITSENFHLSRKEDRVLEMDLE